MRGIVVFCCVCEDDLDACRLEPILDFFVGMSVCVCQTSAYDTNLWDYCIQELLRC